MGHSNSPGVEYRRLEKLLKKKILLRLRQHDRQGQHRQRWRPCQGQQRPRSFNSLASPSLPSSSSPFSSPSLSPSFSLSPSSSLLFTLFSLLLSSFCLFSFFLPSFFLSSFLLSSFFCFLFETSLVGSFYWMKIKKRSKNRELD